MGTGITIYKYYPIRKYSLISKNINKIINRKYDRLNEDAEEIIMKKKQTKLYYILL